MTTTPKPTAAEHEKAETLSSNRLRLDVCLSDEGTRILARCYLALKAQLAESERAGEALRKALGELASLFEEQSPDTRGNEAAWERACDILAADQTENTAEETMTQKKCIHGVGLCTESCDSPLPRVGTGAPAPEKGERFAARVGQAGGLPVTIMATSAAQPPVPILAAEAAAHEVTKMALRGCQAELERVRAELDEAKLRDFEHDKEWAEKCATLRAQVRARRVPTRADDALTKRVAELELQAWVSKSVIGSLWFTADAARRRFDRVWDMYEADERAKSP